MKSASLDSWKTARPVWKPKRYGLVSDRVEAQTERIRRFRLARMEAIAEADRTRERPEGRKVA